MRLAIALLLSFTGAASAADLDGRILEDHSGSALASVEVKVYRTGQRTLAAHLETDTAGHFHAAGLPDGEYRIEATKANFIGATLRMPGVAGGLVIRLVRCGVITGQVSDAQGQPVIGATVYAMPRPADGGPPRPFVTPGLGNYTRVDERGQYRLHGLPPGEYAVAASYGASTAMFGSTGGATVRPDLGSGVQLYHTNQRPQYFPVTGGEQYRNIDFAILPASLHNLSGKVELPDPKMRFWLALIAPDQPGVATAVAETKPDGTFRFEDVPAGVYSLAASGPVNGYGGKAVLKPESYFGRTQVSIASDVDGVTVPVRRGGAASFLLKSSGSPGEGSCPAKASLALIAIEDFASRMDGAGEVNTAKETVIANLAPARYKVTLSGLGELCYQASDVLLDLSSGIRDGVIPVTIAPAGAVHGKLTGAAKPPDYAVALVAADPDYSAPVQVAFPAADGRFSFGGLRPGRYRIIAQPAGDAAKARWVTSANGMIEIQVAGGGPTEMDLPAPAREAR
jgi:hypothetical protein